MLFTLESARALFYRAISEQRLDPSVDCVQRARAAHVQVQKAVVELTGEAMRVCGGRAMLKRYPLERYYRDAPLMIIGEGTNEILQLVIARQLLQKYKI